MQNRHSLSAKYLLSSTLLTLAIVASFNCTKSTNATTGPQPQYSLLPEFFVDKGSDIDSSYISFRGVRKNPDTLEIQATSWGVIEYGLFLDRQNAGKTVGYRMMGICGTVLTKTWQKVTLRNWITSADGDTLQQLSFTNFRDTLSVTVTRTSAL